MNKAVQNGVSQDGIGDTQMPTRNGNLRSDQRRSMSKTVIQNFKDILGIGERDGIAHPVVDDQEVAFCIFCQGASMPLPAKVTVIDAGSTDDGENRAGKSHWEWKGIKMG